MTKIVLADDHPMIRTAIEVLLRETDYEMAGTAETGAATLRVIEEVRPDLLLLDLQMPGGGGMEVVRALQSDKAAPQIIILTAAIDDSSLLEAKKLGVRGMVLKNSDPAYLLECLDRVSSGGTWIDPELSIRADELVQSLSERPRIQLAPRERQLIGFVRQGLRNREIANELGVTEGTVKVYLHGVFEKLGVNSRTELAVRADEFLSDAYIK
ncbi:response regulator [Sphingomonas hankyongi]|uniref:Response regulator transcription factor n=1 Tax=Sphingomonas hankyongi TaxID=2908209 RepID=A0ABT0S122_9SPHN|nr:response regulator transcription factor [Sphingomonas hankyongi]